jgi:cold-inducible RNA-binding protein
MATKLYVGNLSYDTTQDDLKGLFEEAGTVVSCDIIYDKFTSKPKGFAFVEMGSQEDANKAVEQFNGKDLQGRELTVNEARPRAPRITPNFPNQFGGGGGQGGGGGGFKRASGKGSRRGLRNAKRSRKGIF